MMTSGKVGRNDPCPCGSGKKYKKCCLENASARKPLPEIEIPEKVRKHFQERQRREQLRVHRYGKVRAIVHSDFQDYKFVAVGNCLYYSKTWKTFPDFLMDYAKSTLGEDWGNEELAKPYEQRHEIVKWYEGLCRFQRRGERHQDGLFYGIPNGIAHAFYCLAYDLYILRHHTVLQEEVVRRLKHPHQFQGARYELFVAATCIRSGFDIKYEDEADRTVAHPEFIASHQETDQIIAVEAKSRHRPGVLGFRGKIEADSEVKTGVRRVLNKALSKSADYPYAIFIDLNLPPAPGKIFDKPWLEDVWKSVHEDGGPTQGNPDPYNLLVFTNHPDHYGKEEEPYPRGDTIFVVSQYPKVSAEHPQVFAELHKAASQYGNIPNEFPKDLSLIK